MSNQFNGDVERDVRTARFCRVAIYLPVRSWVGERVQLEVSNSAETLGQTDAATGAGHYLVTGGAEQAQAEAARIRGKAVALVRVGA
jgi:hypothetical protein